LSSRPLDEIQAEALDLPRTNRARRAARLIESLDEDVVEDPAEAAEAREAEIARRLEAHRAGELEAIPAEEVLREARRRLSKG
jgi:putative addiction module component (TIGR02574 family)